MRIVCRNAFDLYVGLQEARSLNRSLHAEWLPRLERWQELQPRIKLLYQVSYGLFALAGFLSLLFLCGQLSIQWFAGESRLTAGSLFLLSATGGALVAALFVDRRARRIGNPRFAFRPAPKLNSIEDLWWAALDAEARRLDEQQAAENPKDGDRGEQILMETLKKSLPDTFFGVRGVKCVSWLDNDVLVFGPTGIWLLDSKYWNGEITFAEQHWTKKKQFRVNGVDHTVTDTMENIDVQWRREYEFVNNLLSKELRDWDYRLYGGIVLTHPSAVLRERDRLPVRVDDIETWIGAIRHDPLLPSMDEDSRLKGLDVLLTVSRTFYTDRTFSSKELAKKLYRQEIQRIIDWRRGEASTQTQSIRERVEGLRG